MSNHDEKPTLTVIVITIAAVIFLTIGQPHTAVCSAGYTYIMGK